MIDIFKRVAPALLVIPALFAPQIEAHLFPVAKTIAVNVYHRDPTHICLVQTIERYREDAKAKTFVWRLSPQGEPAKGFPAAPYDPVTHFPITTRNNVRIADGIHEINMCFDIPTPMSGEGAPITFEAEGRYNVWHGLWTITRLVRPFTVTGINTDFAPR
jgi:hypothetical protein